MMLLTIFSGIEFLFFLLGALTTLAVIGLIVLNKNYELNWKAWTSLIIGAFFLLFAIAWSVSSALEGEPRAASMGLVVFGIPGLILLLLGRRFVVAGKVEKSA